MATNFLGGYQLIKPLKMGGSGIKVDLYKSERGSSLKWLVVVFWDHHPSAHLRSACCPNLVHTFKQQCAVFRAVALLMQNFKVQKRNDYADIDNAFTEENVVKHMDKADKEHIERQQALYNVLYDGL